MMRFNRKILAGLATLAGMALVLTACTASEGGDGDASGGHLTVSVSTAQRTLDPAVTPSGGTYFGGSGASNAIFDVLFYHNEQGAIEYVLAEDLSSDDGRTWTLRLRSGIEFSDSTPLDAEAVKFTWERLLDPALGSTYTSEASRVRSIEVVDETTVRFEIDSVDYSFPRTIESTALTWIVPTWADDDRDAFVQKPVGAGPFLLDSWGADDTIELVRNENYWQDGLPVLNSITIRTISDVSTSTDMFLTGATQVRLDTRPISDAELASVQGALVVRPYDGGTYMGFNTSRPPFDDPRARQAVSAAIDNEMYNQVATGGLNVAAETIVAPGSLWYEPSLTQQYDPEFAQKLFDELAAEGKPVHFTHIATPLGASSAFGQMLPTIFAEYDNVTVEVETVDVAAYPVRLLQDRDFDSANSTGQGVTPGFAFINFASGASSNAMSWTDAEFDAALNASRTTDDAEAVAQAYITMQERILAEAPAHFLSQGRAVVSVADGVEGLIVTQSGHPIYTATSYASR